MEVGYPIGPASRWKRFERTIALKCLFAHLLESQSAKRWQRIYLALLAGSLRTLRVDGAESAGRRQVLAQVEGDIWAAVGDIAKSRPVSNYEDDLRFDLSKARLKDRRDEEMRWLMGTAMIVRTMYDAAQNAEYIGPIGAQARIIRCYKKNDLFPVNDKDLRKAWAQKKGVAFFATALLQHVSDGRLEQCDITRDLRKQSELVKFLSHSLYFKQFLLTHQLQPNLRFNLSHIVRVSPLLAGIDPLKPAGPLWLPKDPRRTPQPSALPTIS